MPADPRRLRPSELCRLLNSTPLGPVIDQRLLQKHRTLAGARIGDGTHVDLLRYMAWLRHYVLSAPALKPTDQAAAYARHKERERARNAAASRAGRDIGDIPPQADPRRRHKASQRFRAFCETYFPGRFKLAWSRDHLRVIERIEDAVLRGGLFAVAMPRGSGKTSLCECACLWAVMIGARKFVVLIGASAAAAEENLASIKTELETNELLAADFPEVCLPIIALEGRANKAPGQLCNGQRTKIVWRGPAIVLPTIQGSVASGARLVVTGIEGRVRGMKWSHDGRTVRPDLVIPDDPQTDRSAQSHAMCAKRERILAGAVLGLAGPDQKISGIMPCTVIRRGDMADNILDRERYPDWRGERFKMLYAFPTAVALWDTYRELRTQSLIGGGTGAEATEFYRANQKAMDEGAIVAWPARFEPGEISAVQHAMNLFVKDARAFAAEYQGEPLEDRPQENDLCSADQIAAKINGLPAGTAPIDCPLLTAFIDVHQDLLYWIVCAWSPRFDGAVLDYGAWPEQSRAYYTLRDANPTLAIVHPKLGRGGAIRAGLEALEARLRAQRWPSENGAELSIGQIIIDSSWGEHTDMVYEYCRRSPANLLPSKGLSVRAGDRPLGDRPRHIGEEIGLNWRITPMPNRATRLLTYDTNFWKSFVQSRLATAIGDRGCLALFGQGPHRHRLLADHLTAEFRTRTEGHGRVLDEWRLPPHHPDNHWLDGLVGCAVLGSRLGAALPEHQASAPKASLKLSDLYRQKYGRG